ncbi:V-type ATP synthase subunit D [Candidatus Borkfalkia ceftriaxoniphila]|mgnify:CR=1 FL=1|uniref:V-type ATP synthase subunit D n=1 Tax=Candidatus Borkfalkia ceftriaxoniphila TaxID=2508949 RepID=A0A4Q2KAH5_9FIRM|nr:V-type ATP synthase subunit D [Candidatus Borkfalkia ceftriaxoniphila]RXZ60999.1 V-type ATP synthase subunit D [Candidatus Borkfalkia ceftriaxoniphila]
MARLNKNPTRMELKKLKARLKTAQRGHKLLKDKTDEMVRRFSVLAREIKKLRAETEGDVVRVLKQFSLARGLMPKKDIELLFSMPSVSVEPGCGLGNFMNLEVPKIVLEERKDASSPLPYSYVDVTSEADYAVELAGEVLDKLVRLAEQEKILRMLAVEIERSKRRVNALEYVLIPDLEETIRYISMKLEENERAGLTRLMKVKDMIEAKNANQ